MARAVFAVNCTLTVSRRVLVDAPADVDGDELRDWITDGDLGDGDLFEGPPGLIVHENMRSSPRGSRGDVSATIPGARRGAAGRTLRAPAG